MSDDKSFDYTEYLKAEGFFQDLSTSFKTFQNMEIEGQNQVARAISEVELEHFPEVLDGLDKVMAARCGMNFVYLGGLLNKMQADVNDLKQRLDES